MIGAFKSAGLAAMAMAALLMASPAGAVTMPENDYPTATRADYVFACMQVNGQTRENLMKCSCSIDTIAEILPFKAYEEAETIMSVVQKGGESVSMFQSYQPLIEKVNNMKRAQVEAELRCF